MLNLMAALSKFHSIYSNIKLLDRYFKMVYIFEILNQSWQHKIYLID
ncbi:hypothetical protein MCERHM31_00586 [Methylophilaceae bacterium]